MRLDAEATTEAAELAASIRLQAEANVRAASTPNQQRPATHHTSPTVRNFVSQYQHNVAQLEALGATVPPTATLAQMSELVARDDTQLSPVNDDRAYSGADGESFRDWYARRNGYSPESPKIDCVSASTKPAIAGASLISVRRRKTSSSAILARLVSRRCQHQTARQLWNNRSRLRANAQPGGGWLHFVPGRRPPASVTRLRMITC